MISVTIYRVKLVEFGACSRGLELFDAIAARVRMAGACWEWTGATSGSGYGRIKRSAKNHQVHRLMYETCYGPIPLGMVVCHRCDNRLCVSPEHLFAGTASDNMRDCASKGRLMAQKDPSRLPHGETHKHARLTHADVEMIRALLTSGASARGLAREYGVSDRTIRNIRDRRKWRRTSATGYLERDAEGAQ
jgi:hypothetical protein